MPKVKVKDDLKSSVAAEQRRQDIEAMLLAGKSDTLVAAKLGASTHEIRLAKQRLRAASNGKVR